MSRISHNPEILEYFRSIGVDSEERLEPPSPLSRLPMRAEKHRVGVLAFVAVLLGILVVCILAAAQPTDELTPVEGVSSSNTDPVPEGPLKKNDCLWMPFPFAAFSREETYRSIASDVRPEERLSVSLDYTVLEKRVSHLEKINRLTLPLVAAVGVYAVASALPFFCPLLRRFARWFLSAATFLGRRLQGGALHVRRARTAASLKPSSSSELPPRNRCVSEEKTGGYGGADSPGRATFPIELSLPRELGFQSITGPVRLENEDACVAWNQGPYKIAVVADGLGGHPEGGTAARLASLEAARALSTAVGTGHFQTDQQACIAAAFRYASNALYERAMVPGFQARDGLRTTLIALVCTPSGYHWGYIGDGGLWVRRRSGDLEKLLSPHKADALHPNILAASLGPATQGTPEFGEAERRKGDLLFVGTDGVFDRVEDSFAEDVAVLAARAFCGNLQRSVEETLRQLSSAKDEAGYLCDDNMTLVLIANQLEVLSAQTGALTPQESVEEQKISQGDNSDASTHDQRQ